MRYPLTYAIDGSNETHNLVFASVAALAANSGVEMSYPIRVNSLFLYLPPLPAISVNESVAVPPSVATLFMVNVVELLMDVIMLPLAMPVPDTANPFESKAVLNAVTSESLAVVIHEILYEEVSNSSRVPRTNGLVTKLPDSSVVRSANFLSRSL